MTRDPELLRPFTEPTLCPKCFAGDVTVQYHANAHEYGCPLKGEFYEPECCTLEHFDRRCKRCAYTWCEAIAAKETA